MAVDKVLGVAVLSGKGGVGKSVIALNLALAMGKFGVRTLLFDAGGGDLNHLANCGATEGFKGIKPVINIGENVGLYNSMIDDSYSILSEEEIELFLSEIVKASSGYDCVVFDSLTGAGPVSYTLAGLSDLSMLVTTADPTAIASAYALAKALHQDGLATRCGVLFNMVKSADEAASLKTRFDILTERFINSKFEQSDYIHNDSLLAESVIEQQPLLTSGKGSPAASDFLRIASIFKQSARFHTETSILKS